jgi:hypothetical protein
MERPIVDRDDRSCAEQLGGYGRLPRVHAGRQGTGRLAWRKIDYRTADR